MTENETVHLSLALDAGYHKSLKSLCKSRGLTLSSQVRWLIIKELEKEGLKEKI